MSPNPLTAKLAALAASTGSPIEARDSFARRLEKADDAASNKSAVAKASFIFRTVRYFVVLLLLASCAEVLFLGQIEREGTLVEEKDAVEERVAAYSYTFPTVNQRFEYYMGDWYNKTGWQISDCSMLAQRTDVFDRDLVATLQTLDACAKSGDGNIVKYCSDAHDTLSRARSIDELRPKIIFHFGDSSPSASLPAISKSRMALSQYPAKPRPILWPLNIHRHYHDLYEYHANYSMMEVPWEDKLPAVIWRGKPTGNRVELLGQWVRFDPTVVDVAFSGVLRSSSGFHSEFMATNLVREQMSVGDMIQYKYLLSVEGNDVATGLKWMLSSKSVVLMSPPTRATWAMEDLLMPFVHYIPLSKDMSNLLEMIAWAERHQEACREISARATEFIARLAASKQAHRDNDLLREKLATAYVEQFHEPLSRCEAEMSTIGDNSQSKEADETTMGGVSGGHWERAEDASPPYTFSPRLCDLSFLNRDDCIKTQTCPSDLMNWIYVGSDGKPYPRFDADGFRRRMRNRRILFIGPSMVRQQVQSLVWSLGHENIDWDVTYPPKEINCTASRRCMTDISSNVTLCWQFSGSMSTKRVYREGNYTLDHSLRGNGDSSCLVRDEMIPEFEDFDLAIVQSVVWWPNLVNILDSPNSPSEWLKKMVPVMYRDAMGILLSRLSKVTKTVFTLGQIGVDCKNKTEPERFSMDSIPDKFGWNLAPQLWETSLSLIEEGGLDVQVVDAREPLMQSVHAHPSPDCLHFCLNSAAVNIYLDMYWNEVFSQYSG